MKTNLVSVKKCLAILLVLFTGLNARAQDWNDMVDWIQGGGIDRLAELAHPNDAQQILRKGIVDVSPSKIVLKITYKGLISPYTDTYTIMKGTYKGSEYFRRVRVDEVYDPFFSAFNSIENLGVGYAELYGRMDVDELYGDNESYWDLSKGEKAAFILYCQFLQFYNY